jgi:cyanate permease
VREFRRAAVGTVLLGAGAGYAAGVVGPPVHAISSDFDVSLAAIGLLTSAFFAGVVALNLAAPWLDRRIGPRSSVHLAALLMCAGSILCAVAPAFGVLLGARVLAGLGVAIALIMGGLVGRAVGGPPLLGIYGGAITICVAIALALGGALESAGVDWRVEFAVAAVFGVSALPFFTGSFPEIPRPPRGVAHDLMRAFASWAYWRVALLFVFAAGVPLIVSAWIVHYLTADGAMSAEAAGAVGFLLFAVSTLARPAGSKADERYHPLILLASPFLAAAGFVLLALDAERAFAMSAIAVGIGFSIPYAVSYIRSEDLGAEEPALGLSAESWPSTSHRSSRAPRSARPSTADTRKRPGSRSPCSPSWPPSRTFRARRRDRRQSPRDDAAAARRNDRRRRRRLRPQSHSAPLGGSRGAAARGEARRGSCVVAGAGASG